MARGGRRPGAGRPKGSKNYHKLHEVAAKLAAQGRTPLQFWMGIIENPDPLITPQLRVEAAKAAAPYIHPKLSSIEHSGPDGGAIKVILNGSDADL